MEKDDIVIFDQHHRVPGDDETLIDLCRPCHIKLHKLTDNDGGDKMTPRQDDRDDNDNDRGDKSDMGDDTGGIKGVTPMTPEPSVNHHLEPSIKPSEEEGKPVGPVGLLQNAFIDETGRPLFGIRPQDNEAGVRMVKASVTPEIVIQAVQELRGNYTLVGLKSVENGCYTIMDRRKGKRKGKILPSWRRKLTRWKHPLIPLPR